MSLGFRPSAFSSGMFSLSVLLKTSVYTVAGKSVGVSEIGSTHTLIGTTSGAALSHPPSKGFLQF